MWLRGIFFVDASASLPYRFCLSLIGLAPFFVGLDLYKSHWLALPALPVHSCLP